ncbi:MAG TPA: PAC2 family protein [Microthrixaceae bacterium]|nr:PAC2 family protein [Microthrixaceae bacterium]
MSNLVTLSLHPPLHEPVLVVVLEGWIDAGAAASTAMQTILDGHHSELVATFDSDELLDHRARRPMMSLVEGEVTSLAWPSIELRAITDDRGRHVLVLVGAEPDHAWRRFTDAVVELALDLGVTSVVGLGAYPAAVPHTRDTNLALTSPSAVALEAFSGFVRGTVDVPGGIQASIEYSASTAGLTALGLWAQVPHYISGMPYAPAAIALIEGLGRITGLELQQGELVSEAATGRDHLDQLISGNPQHQAMITQLEEIYDATDLGGGFGPLPTGDELAAELQAFLREHGDG